jgi:hypothetical protein
VLYEARKVNRRNEYRVWIRKLQGERDLFEDVRADDNIKLDLRKIG